MSELCGIVAELAVAARKKKDEANGLFHRRTRQLQDQVVPDDEDPPSVQIPSHVFDCPRGVLLRAGHDFSYFDRSAASGFLA